MWMYLDIKRLISSGGFVFGRKLVFEVIGLFTVREDKNREGLYLEGILYVYKRRS